MVILNQFVAFGTFNSQIKSNLMCVNNRGDPTLVKTNVAITTGYLISGKRNLSR